MRVLGLVCLVSTVFYSSLSFLVSSQAAWAAESEGHPQSALVLAAARVIQTLPNMLTRAPRSTSHQLGDRRPRSRINLDRRRCAHGLADQQAGYLNGIDALLLIAVTAIDMPASSVWLSAR